MFNDLKCFANIKCHLLREGPDGLVGEESRAHIEVNKKQIKGLMNIGELQGLAENSDQEKPSLCSQ